MPTLVRVAATVACSQYMRTAAIQDGLLGSATEIKCIVYSSNMAIGSRFDPLIINAETLVAQHVSVRANTGQSVQDQLEGLLVRVQSGELPPCIFGAFVRVARILS